MRRRLPLVLAALAALVLPAAAGARDPHRWHYVGRTVVPIQYYQGMAADGPRRLWFDGIEKGLYRTSERRILGFTPGTSPSIAAAPDEIPASVAAVDKYNHIGDIAYDPGHGGRVLLPMECYDGTNCAGTGSIGVADPDSLAWRYYVKLAPAEIPKAMWCEVSPDGKLLWTSVDDDLLAYRLSDITRAHAAPAAKPIHAVRRLRGAVPPSGITGAAFYGGRLYLAGSQGHTYQVWSVNVRTGARRLEIERTIVGESEGLAVVDAFGGALQWMIQPIRDGDTPPTYAEPSILSFLPRVHPRVAARPRALVRGRRVTVRLRVTGRVLGRARPLSGATVRALGAHATTDAHGRARLTVRPRRAGRLAVRARWRGDRGRGHVTVVAPPASGRG